MGIQDIIITPIYLILILISAVLIRPLVTNQATRPYFIPGLIVKFVGAISLGLIYQYYYNGGDTFNFHTHGSVWIWKAFRENPLKGLQLMFASGEYNGSTWEYSSNIWFYRDQASYFIIRIAAFFDIFTFGTYSSTALFFACFTFSGHWVLFHSFQKFLPSKTKQLALVCLFIPSVIFWGSGILKDSITLSALCWITYSLFELVVWKKRIILHMILLVFFGWILYSIKIYILLCFLAAASIFLYLRYIKKIQHPVIKLISMPLLIAVFVGGGVLAINQISKDNQRYALENIGETARLTAYDIRYGWGARHGDNSGYTLGELDGSIGSLLRLAPNGVMVTLFRPWIWEVKNPLMLLAAIESLIVLILTIYAITIAIRTAPRQIWNKLNNPVVAYCLTFSLLFAFAVGVSTYNFGTLMRYKIPIMPFYLAFLVIFSTRNKDV